MASTMGLWQRFASIGLILVLWSRGIDAAVDANTMSGTSESESVFGLGQVNGRKSGIQGRKAASADSNADVFSSGGAGDKKSRPPPGALAFVQAALLAVQSPSRRRAVNMSSASTLRRRLANGSKPRSSNATIRSNSPAIVSTVRGMTRSGVIHKSRRRNASFLGALNVSGVTENFSRAFHGGLQSSHVSSKSGDTSITSGVGPLSRGNSKVVIPIAGITKLAATKTTSLTRPPGVKCQAGMYNTAPSTWQDMTTSQRVAARACNLTSQSWNGPTRCLRCYDDLSETQQVAVQAMGYSPSCYNAALRPVLKCDPSVECDIKYHKPQWMNQLWQTLTSYEQSTLKQCGFSAANWNAFGTCFACFADLRPEQQQALQVLRTDAGCWDSAAQLMGINCTHGNSQDRQAIHQSMLQAKFEMEQVSLIPKGNDTFLQACAAGIMAFVILSMLLFVSLHRTEVPAWVLGLASGACRRPHLVRDSSLERPDRPDAHFYAMVRSDEVPLLDTNDSVSDNPLE